MDIVVTDLTHMSGGKICIAGIDPTTGRCFRPEPYKDRVWCAENGVEPGVVLRGAMKNLPNTTNPHIEDRYCKALCKADGVEVEDLCDLLARTLSASVCDGFGSELPESQKYYPRDAPPGRSIVTIEVKDIRIVYNYSKVKAHVTDSAGREFSFLPVADLLLREYVLGQDEDARSGACAHVTRHLRAQDHVYCRIGLGRAFKAKDDRDGYWLQVNGIYSCPISWREGV